MDIIGGYIVEFDICICIPSFHQCISLNSTLVPALGPVSSTLRIS